MANRYAKLLRYGLFAFSAAVLPLTGCTSTGFSSFGSNKLEVAELSATESYTADGALLKARSHFRNNDFGYSAAYYKKAVELNPNDPEGYIGLSASYDQLGRFELSDRVYAALFKLNGGTLQYYNNVGYSNLLRGNLKGAFTNFDKAARLSPDNVVVANNIQMLSDAAKAGRA